jgi:hypothetical protein
VRDGFQVGKEGEIAEMTGDEKKTMKGEGEANAGEGEGQIFSLHPRTLYSAFVVSKYLSSPRCSPRPKAVRAVRSCQSSDRRRHSATFHARLT